MTIILITGGARSGKSRHAESLALSMADRVKAVPIYIATAQAYDDEMAERIAAHQSRRGTAWRDIEAPLALADTLDRTDGAGPRLVDCLTLWLSNVVFAERDWLGETEALCARLRLQSSPVVLVTNEVGLGIVPDNALARRFRDYAGLVNQMVAEVADSVIFTVAGLPMKVK